MSQEASTLGNHVFKAIFAVTMPWGLGVLLGFAAEPLLEGTLPDLLGISANAVFLGLLVLLYGITFAILWPGLKVGRTWLSLPKRVSLKKALLSTALWAFVGYAVALPACFVLGLLMTRGNTDGEAGVFVVMFSVWMSLWWAVPIGTLMAWRRERQYQNRAKPKEEGPQGDAAGTA